ncbi:MAG: hypothetical protein LBV30_11030 [Propionibacteriaceae bacterium]|nr:hypothetical protein [Propionibacteriaceae bacterium]
MGNNVDTCIIRLEELNDQTAIAAVTKQAFRDMEISQHTEHLVIDALRAAGALTLSMVAELPGVGIVGHIAFSPLTITANPEADDDAVARAEAPTGLRPDAESAVDASSSHPGDTSSTAQGAVAVAPPTFDQAATQPPASASTTPSQAPNQAPTSPPRLAAAVLASAPASDIGSWYCLGPVSVLPVYQGQGIGARLIRAGLNALEAMGATGVILVGHPEYYPRFGFINQPGLIYEGIPDEYVFSLAFNGQYPTGVITDHDAFRVTTRA